MAYNYAKEKRRFDAEWKRKELWYRKEGMVVSTVFRTLVCRLWDE